jgi:hypothetical protein
MSADQGTSCLVEEHALTSSTVVKESCKFVNFITVQISRVTSLFFTHSVVDGRGPQEYGLENYFPCRRTCPYQ